MPRHRRYPAGRAATVVAVVVVQLSSPLLPSSTSPPCFVAEARSSSSSCVDTPDWRDMYGDTCTYYSSGPDDRCEVWGGTGAGEMGVADDNCCVCGGGTDAKTTASTAGGGGVRGGTTTKTMTAATTRPADIILADAGGDIVVVNPDGTCGKGRGDRGNGICRDGKCCSRVRRDYFPLLANVSSVDKEGCCSFYALFALRYITPSDEIACVCILRLRNARHVTDEYNSLDNYFSPKRILISHPTLISFFASSDGVAIRRITAVRRNRRLVQSRRSPLIIRPTRPSPVVLPVVPCPALIMTTLRLGVTARMQSRRRSAKTSK